MPTLREWLDRQWERESLLWIKRLSPSDTLASGNSDPGPRIPIDLAVQFLPDLLEGHANIREVNFIVEVDSSDTNPEVIATLYADKLTRRDDGTRVLTSAWGGYENALLDPDNAGAIAVFAFNSEANGGLPTCAVWVCANLDQEGIIESDWGPIDPGYELIWSHSKGTTRRYLL